MSNVNADKINKLLTLAPKVIKWVPISSCKECASMCINTFNCKIEKKPWNGEGVPGWCPLPGRLFPSLHNPGTETYESLFKDLTDYLEARLSAFSEEHDCLPSACAAIAGMEKDVGGFIARMDTIQKREQDDKSILQVIQESAKIMARYVESTSAPVAVQMAANDLKIAVTLRDLRRVKVGESDGG